MRMLVIAVLLGTTISAQSSVVRISGSAMDRYGSYIVDMCVSAKPIGSASIIAGVRTDDQGRYTLSGLPRGSYELIFLEPEHDISTWKRHSVIVNADQDEVSLSPVTLEVSDYSPDYDAVMLDRFLKSRHSSGTIEAHESCSLDLDGGKAFCGGNEGQASLERDGGDWYIVPKNGSRVAAAKGRYKPDKPCHSTRG